MSKLHITFKDAWTGKYGLEIDWNDKYFIAIGFGEGIKWGKS